MNGPTKVVAIIAASTALSSILAMVLAGDVRLRVRQFDNPVSLRAYMRIARVDVLVCDFDCEDAPAARLIYDLRRDESIDSPDFAVIALTRSITTDMRHISIRAGIDEVIVKPMSPRHLLERVQARLRIGVSLVSGENGYRGPDRRDRVAFAVGPTQHQRRRTDNVVALFPDRRALPKHPGLQG